MRPIELIEELFWETNTSGSLLYKVHEKYENFMHKCISIISQTDDEIKVNCQDDEGYTVETIFSFRNTAKHEIQEAVKVFLKLLNAKLDELETNEKRLDYLVHINLQLNTSINIGKINHKKFEDLILSETKRAFIIINDYISSFNIQPSLPNKQLNWVGQQNQFGQLIKSLIDNPSQNKGNPFFSNTPDEVWDFFSNYFTISGAKINISDLKRLSAEEKVPKDGSPKEIKLDALI
jgi:hypothetical protein